MANLTTNSQLLFIEGDVNNDGDIDAKDKQSCTVQEVVDFIRPLIDTDTDTDTDTNNTVTPTADGSGFSVFSPVTGITTVVPFPTPTPPESENEFFSGSPVLDLTAETLTFPTETDVDGNPGTPVVLDISSLITLLTSSPHPEILAGSGVTVTTNANGDFVISAPDTDTDVSSVLQSIIGQVGTGEISHTVRVVEDGVNYQDTKRVCDGGEFENVRVGAVILGGQAVVPDGTVGAWTPWGTPITYTNTSNCDVRAELWFPYTFAMNTATGPAMPSNLRFQYSHTARVLSSVQSVYGGTNETEEHGGYFETLNVGGGATGGWQVSTPSQIFYPVILAPGASVTWTPQYRLQVSQFNFPVEGVPFINVAPNTSRIGIRVEVLSAGAV